jgi:hypothetical protein
MRSRQVCRLTTLEKLKRPETPSFRFETFHFEFIIFLAKASSRSNTVGSVSVSTIVVSQKLGVLSEELTLIPTPRRLDDFKAVSKPFSQMQKMRRAREPSFQATSQMPNLPQEATAPALPSASG